MIITKVNHIFFNVSVLVFQTTEDSFSTPAKSNQFNRSIFIEAPDESVVCFVPLLQVYIADIVHKYCFMFGDVARVVCFF